MAARKHPQGLLCLPSRQADSHAWHSSAQQGVDRGRLSAGAPGCSPPTGLLPAVPQQPWGPPHPHCQVTAWDPRGWL